MYEFIISETVLILLLDVGNKTATGRIYKFIFNGTVLILPLGICVCTLITMYVRIEVATRCISLHFLGLY